MIAIRNLSILLWAILFATLAACGSDDDPAPAGGGGGGGTTPQAVELEQLSGTWFGTFLGSDGVETFQFDINGAEISNVMLNDAPDPGISGSILERADEVGEGQRVFRFEATAGTNDINGILIVDPTATYMVYLYTNQQFGVLQKGATEMPVDGFTADAIAGSWDGITVTAPTVMDQEAPLSPVEQANSSAECTTNSEDDTSECAITIGETAKTASALTLDPPELGFWTGTYEADGTARMLLSADANFAGLWGCTGLPDGFPENCDFSAWTKGEAGTEEPTEEQPEEGASEEGTE